MASIAGADAQVVRDLSDWNVWEVTSDTLNKFSHLPRNRPIVGAYISGSRDQPKVMNGISALAAMDLIIEETNPQPNEPLYNVYHLVYEVSAKGDVTQWGVFRDKCILPHWPPQTSVAEIHTAYAPICSGKL